MLVLGSRIDLKVIFVGTPVGGSRRSWSVLGLELTSEGGNGVGLRRR
jgi:hypothetical protein